MQFQIGNVLLQLPSQDDLGTVLALGTIIHQQEVSMSIVEHGQFRSVYNSSDGGAQEQEQENGGCVQVRSKVK